MGYVEDFLNMGSEEAWTPEEDEKLSSAIKKVSSASGLIKDWDEVSLEVGRKATHCKRRWLNVLHPDIKYFSWTKEEDERLLQAFSSLGAILWTSILDVFNSSSPDGRQRSLNQCLSRVHDLCDGKVSQKKAKEKLLLLKTTQETVLAAKGKETVDEDKSADMVDKFQLVEADKVLPNSEGLASIISNYTDDDEWSFTNLFSRASSKIQRRILMVGLKSAGKSTILQKLKLGNIKITSPIIGFNVECVEYGNISFTVWDVGAQDKIQPSWRSYFSNTDGLILVVDSNDRDRVVEARGVLHRIVKEDNLRDVVLLVFANKKDAANAMTDAEMTRELGLQSIRGRHHWYIKSISAISGEGLYEGLDWLSNNMRTRSR